MPEPSPRETKVAPESTIFWSASAADVMPAIPAGSLFGPTMRNVLCMTSSRSTPLPAAMNSFSAAGECTSRTSASPFAPISIA